MNNSSPLIEVNVDGKIAQWDGHTFSGHPAIVNEAILSAEIKADYTLGEVSVVAGDDSLLGAAAALASYRPGRTNFTILPEDVAEALLPEHNHPENIG